jgi:glycosyltransferase involved in cell wall biosynthesis
VTNKQLHIIMAMLFQPRGRTGVHTHIDELGCYLDRVGISHEVVTPFSWGGGLRPVVFGARVAFMRWAPSCDVLWYRYWHRVFLQQALRQRVSSVSGAVVYAQDPLAADAALRARVSKSQKVVLVVHYPGSEADEWVRNGRIRSSSRGARTIFLQEASIVPKVDGLVYVSQSVKDQLEERIPVAEKIPAIVVHNFLSNSPPQLGQEDGERDAEIYGDLVSVGRLEPVKNHRFLLDVLSVARQQGIRPTLHVYGEGSLRRRLEHEARELGLGDQVEFRGFCHGVRSLLPHYRLYVHAAVAEPFGYAVLEAMAAGVPVLAPKIGGIPELLSSSGYYWPLDDVRRASKVLVECLASGSLREAGERARSRFLARFQTSVLAPRLVSFLCDS